MTGEYRKAVEFAEEFLRPQISDGKLVQHSVEPTEFLYIFGLPIEQRTDDHEWCPTYYCYPEHALRFLCLHARNDKGAYDILGRIIAGRILRNKPLSDAERMFAGQIMAGVWEAPASEAKRSSKSFALNLHLLFIARLVRERFGLKLFRNDSGGSGMSACDAVSEACCTLGMNKSFRAIKDIFMHASYQRVRDISDEMLKYQVDHRREARSEGHENEE